MFALTAAAVASPNTNIVVAFIHECNNRFYFVSHKSQSLVMNKYRLVVQKEPFAVSCLANFNV